jgi:hypothetical protein
MTNLVRLDPRPLDPVVAQPGHYQIEKSMGFGLFDSQGIYFGFHGGG